MHRALPHVIAVLFRAVVLQWLGVLKHNVHGCRRGCKDDRISRCRKSDGKFCCDAIGTLNPRALLSVILDSHVEREPDQCPNLASSVAESSDEHAYVAPDLFTAETPLGTYQGITDQVIMSRTPGSFSTVLVPRGSSKPEWLAR